MKTKKKNFDCVKMKKDIQKKLSGTLDGLSASKINEAIDREISAGPLAEIWKKICRRRKQ